MPDLGPLAGWAWSGAMALTGRPDGPPLAAPGDPAGLVSAALRSFAEGTVARTGREPALPGIEILGERAALAGLHRNAPGSCGGRFRFLPTVDGYAGLSLVRPEDVDLVPALVESEGVREESGIPTPALWRALAEWAARERTAAVIERIRLLGLACAEVPDADAAALPPGDAPPPARVVRTGSARTVTERPLILDFSSLWAGPLCARLLAATGAEVVKVESRARPDGARRGPSAFFDLLHQGTSAVAVDLDDAEELARLRALVARADLVIEGSRPRALRRWGLDAEAVVDDGTAWVSITAYGRSSDAIGYGDDVAADAGMLAWEDDEPRLCGDALADPVSGAIAADAAARALIAGRATLVEVSMRDAMRAARSLPGPGTHEVTAGDDGWIVHSEGERYPVQLPRAPRPAGHGPAIGSGNARLLT
ncbi:CoA transferase [Microbacterium sp. X-17]|uniref:CoA transferase n=1 Tax=Microbacterium sp. X-17 TaxID=3144404 RepID=UPI0031F50F39